MTKYENLIPRFLKYVERDTQSDETTGTVPSTPAQAEFAKDLAEELKQLGVSDVHINVQSGYVIGTIPSNLDHEVPTIGFISHIDTADFTAKNVAPQIVEDYDGESVIKLDQAGQYVLDPKVFPNLKHYQGDTLITTDGSTLLGADDKAGVAEIVTFAEYLMTHPEVKHGKLMVGLGPDEEIGTGADHFDVDDFKVDMPIRLMVAH